MILTRNWIAAFFISGLFEIVEAIMVTATQDFVVFAGAANSLENLPDALIDDWLIQAGLGTLLGAWVLLFFFQANGHCSYMHRSCGISGLRQCGMGGTLIGGSSCGGWYGTLQSWYRKQRLASI